MRDEILSLNKGFFYTMQSDEVIHSLNNKKGVFTDRFGHFSYPALSEAEQTLLNTCHPENAFITYGSLSPGGINHNFVKNIPGEWQKGTVLGKLENKGWGADLGYHGYRPAMNEQPEQITAYLLLSREMGSHWRRLDEFEGEGYIRQLARFTSESGLETVGYIYAVRWNIY